MKRWLQILGIALLVSATAGVLPGFAGGDEGVAGSVAAVRGEVRATGPRGDRLLAMKGPVFVSDTIRTGKGARAQLLFRDNTVVSLGENTVMTIAAYSWDAEKRDGAMKTRVEEGTFRVLGGLITRTAPKSFATETPAATIGIRGSMYAGSFHGNQLQVVFTGGRGIYVVNPYGQVDLDQPGYGTRVTVGAPPEPPSRMAGPELAGLIEGLGAGNGGGQPGLQLSPENADLLGFEPGAGIDGGTLPLTERLAPELPATRTGDIQSGEAMKEATKPVPDPAGHPYVP